MVTDIREIYLKHYERRYMLQFLLQVGLRSLSQMKPWMFYISSVVSLVASLLQKVGITN
jgi:hypothetical protein